MVSKKPIKRLVCARFRAWGGKKVVFIWIAKTKAKLSKFWSFLHFWRFLSRNVTFFALKGWITFTFYDKCEKWQNSDGKTPYTCEKSCIGLNFIFSRNTSKTHPDFTWNFVFQFRRLFVDRDEGHFLIILIQNHHFHFFTCVRGFR